MVFVDQLKTCMPGDELALQGAVGGGICIPEELHMPPSFSRCMCLVEVSQLGTQACVLVLMRLCGHTLPQSAVLRRRKPGSHGCSVLGAIAMSLLQVRRQAVKHSLMFQW